MFDHNPIPLHQAFERKYRWYHQIDWFVVFIFLVGFSIIGIAGIMAWDHRPQDEAEADAKLTLQVVSSTLENARMQGFDECRSAVWAHLKDKRLAKEVDAYLSKMETK